MALADINLPQNSATLIHFQQLKAENRTPKLGVYRGRELIIVSYKSNGILETIGQLFRQILLMLLKACGLISQDKRIIRPLKELVRDYYFKQVQQHQGTDFQNEEKAYRDKIDALQKKLDLIQINTNALTNEQQRLNKDIQVAKDEKNNLSHDIQNLKREKQQLETDYQAARNIIQQKQAAERVVQRLNADKLALTNEIAQLEASKDALQPVRDELEDLKKKRDEVKADITQNDYKAKCEKQKQTMLNMLDSFKKNQQTLLAAAKFDHDQEKKLWQLEQQQLNLQITALKVQVQDLQMKNKFNL